MTVMNRRPNTAGWRVDRRGRAAPLTERTYGGGNCTEEEQPTVEGNALKMPREGEETQPVTRSRAGRRQRPRGKYRHRAGKEIGENLEGGGGFQL
jgi:hypothetical protein